MSNRYIVEVVDQDGEGHYFEFSSTIPALDRAMSITSGDGWDDVDWSGMTNIIWRRAKCVGDELVTCSVYELEWDYDPNDEGYILEYLTDTGKWRPSELANNWNYEIYSSNRGDEHDEWDESEIHTKMFKDHDAWGDISGDDWTDRLGLKEWDILHPCECSGKDSDNTRYRIRRVRLGDLSEEFMEFTRTHPWVDFTRENWLDLSHRDAMHSVSLVLTGQEMYDLKDLAEKELEEWESCSCDSDDGVSDRFIAVLRKLITELN